jgi:hypothetical protein
VKSDPASGPGRSSLLSFARVWALPAALAVVFVARCVILSSKRLLLGDEFFTWYPVSASFHAMLASTSDTLNTAPPLYTIGAWLWAAVFGNSAASLRILSALALSVAVFAMFKVLNRAYGPLAAAAALTVAFVDPELLSQSVSARSYTLVLAEMALGILLYQQMMAQPRPSLGLLAANVGLHACLVMTHYFGLIYSGVILAAVLLTCFLRRRSPLRAVLSIVAGWLVFVPWIPVLLLHLQMGKPTFWIPVPTARDLAGYFGHYITGDFWLFVWILFALAAAAWALAAASGPIERSGNLRIWAIRVREAPLLLLALLLSLVPLAIYVLSTRKGGTSSFLDRYMLPGSLGWAIICAHVASRVLRLRLATPPQARARVLARLQAAAVVLFVGWCSFGLIGAARAETAQDLPGRLPARVPVTEPVVVEYYYEFLELHFYSPEARRYLFLVDQAAGVEEGGGGPVNHQIMAALKRNFPDQFKEVVPVGDFLAGATSFWVRTYRLEWWKFRMAHNRDFVADFAIPERRLLHEQRVSRKE